MHINGEMVAYLETTTGSRDIFQESTLSQRKVVQRYPGKSLNLKAENFKSFANGRSRTVPSTLLKHSSCVHATVVTHTAGNIPRIPLSELSEMNAKELV